MSVKTCHSWSETDILVNSSAPLNISSTPAKKTFLKLNQTFIRFVHCWLPAVVYQMTAVECKLTPIVPFLFYFFDTCFFLSFFLFGTFFRGSDALLFVFKTLSLQDCLLFLSQTAKGQNDPALSKHANRLIAACAVLSCYALRSGVCAGNCME